MILWFLERYNASIRPFLEVVIFWNKIYGKKSKQILLHTRPFIQMNIISLKIIQLAPSSCCNTKKNKFKLHAKWRHIGASLLDQFLQKNMFTTPFFFLFYSVLISLSLSVCLSLCFFFNCFFLTKNLPVLSRPLFNVINL